MSSLETEFAWRMIQWEILQQSPNWPNLTAQEIRELKLYSGAAGIYRDKNRTHSLAEDGIAVSIMNSSGHYSDEISEDVMIYDYPKTDRSRSHDAGEIASLKNAMLTRMPLFVISEISGNRRRVDLGWVTSCEDSASACLIKLHQQPEEKFDPLAELSVDFISTVPRKLTTSQIKRLERDPKFKFKALVLYQTTCALTDVKVERMLDAAHVIPVAENGTDDPRNSLLLSASIHRAFDANYWAIEPESLVVATRKQGPTLDQKKIIHKSILHLENKPHPEALEHRWNSFVKATDGKILLAS